SLEKQLGWDRARGDGVDRYVSATQFIGKNADQAFRARFGSDVGTIVRKGFSNDAAGESDDAAACGNMLGRLSQHQKSSAQIGRDYFVESFDIASRDWKQGHNSRRVHDHVDRAKSFKRLLEESLDVRGLRHV